MVPQRHAFVLRHITSHSRQGSRARGVHMILQLEIFLDLSDLHRSVIFLDFNIGQQLSNYLFFFIRQYQPISLTSWRCVMQLHRSLTNLLTSKEHRLLVQSEIKLLHIVSQLDVFLLDTLQMFDSCLRQLLVLKAELLVPFWILSCFSCCTFRDWVRLILSVLKIIRPVYLRILKFNFAIDIHGAEEGWQIFWKFGFQNSTDHQIVLLESILWSWICWELLAFLHLALTWGHQHRCSRALGLLRLYLALRHRFSVPHLRLSSGLRFQPYLCWSSTWCCCSIYLLLCFWFILLLFQIDLAHFLPIFDLFYLMSFFKIK